jgi:uncharacterized membrane protein affecting hemolysin expression
MKRSHRRRLAILIAALWGGFLLALSRYRRPRWIQTGNVDQTGCYPFGEHDAS